MWEASLWGHCRLSKRPTPNREHVLKDASNNSFVKITFYSLNAKVTVSPHEFKSCDSLSRRDLSLPLFRAMAGRLSPIISHAARFRSIASVLVCTEYVYK